MITSSDLMLDRNMRISGKWNRRSYKIIRLLGEGANGKVYLVTFSGEPYAMKIGYESLDLQSEINALRMLDRTGQKAPFLIDADDFEQQGRAYSFYVMKYVRGERLADYLQKYGSEWLMVIGHHLLKSLNHLHRLGWIFGDIKPENILVTGYGKVELVDYGGLAAMGKSVKQFTQIYDRGYWGGGTRIADPAYDLFSFAILILQLTDDRGRIEKSHQLLPQQRTEGYLLEVLHTTQQCLPISAILESAIRGKYRFADEALRDWSNAMLRFKKSQRKSGSWLRGFFIASVLLFVTAVFMVWR